MQGLKQRTCFVSSDSKMLADKTASQREQILPKCPHLLAESFLPIIAHLTFKIIASQMQKVSGACLNSMKATTWIN